jgi:hypothetical protein
MLTSIWPGIVGGTPTQQALAVLVSHSDYETGAWANMWNWNVGNLTGTGSNYVTLTAIDGNPINLQAYSSFTAGATAYLQLLQNHYPASLTAAAQGDLAGFAAALQAGGYFGSQSTASYLAGLQSRYPTVAAALGTPAPASSSATGSSSGSTLLVALLGGLAIGGAAFYLSTRAPAFVRRARR